jgi:hypothetical protein
LTCFRKMIMYLIPRKPSRGNQVVPCHHTDGRTDRHDKAKSIFLQFKECALKAEKNFVPTSLAEIFRMIAIQSSRIQTYLLITRTISCQKMGLVKCCSLSGHKP